MRNKSFSSRRGSWTAGAHGFLSKSEQPLEASTHATKIPAPIDGRARTRRAIPEPYRKQPALAMTPRSTVRVARVTFGEPLVASFVVARPARHDLLRVAGLDFDQKLRRAIGPQDGRRPSLVGDRDASVASRRELESFRLHVRRGRGA